MSIEDSCLEGRWPGSCPVSGRRGSGPSSAIDAQVPKSEKEMMLSNEAQTLCLEYLGCEVKGKRFGDSFVLVCHVDQVEKRSQGGQFGHKNTSIGESETPWTLFTRFLVLEEKPGHSHVGGAEVWRGLVDPLGNLPQDVPLPVVGRTLHLGRKIYFLNCFWQRLCFMRQNKLRLDKAWYYNCWKAQTFNTHCSSSPPCHEALNT